MNKIVCGLDVSKRWLDAGIDAGQQHQRFANSVEGIAELVAFCAMRRVELVVMEATGGHERQAFMLLWAHNIPCATVNPRQVRRFAEALGFFEKTDRIDALVLARFGEADRTEPQPPPSESQQRLRRLSKRLSQISGDISLHKQRLALAEDDEIRVSLGEILALLKRQSKSLQGEICSIIDDDPLWAKLDEACRSLKGVADKTVTLILADLPELGVYSNKAITKLVGLAPHPDDSGERNGHRSIRGGRASVRSILYLIGQCVRKYHSGLDDFCRRLEGKNKKKMVVRIALARKVLVMLNARARDARAAYASAA